MAKSKKSKKTAQKEQPSSLKAYWKIYREAKAYSQDELGQPYTDFELRALASDIQKLYFKGRSANKISKKDIQYRTFTLTYDDESEIYDVEENKGKVPPPPPEDEKGWFNPLLISTEDITGIPWFNIDAKMREDILPMTMGKKMNIIVDGGGLGRVAFNASNYTYDGVGLSGLVEQVRKFSENNSPPEFNGFPVRMEGKPDNGMAPNYALKFVLFDKDGSSMSSIEEAMAPMSSEEQKKRLEDIEKGIQSKFTQAAERMEVDRDRASKRKRERPGKKVEVEGKEPIPLPTPPKKGKKASTGSQGLSSDAKRDIIKDFQLMLAQARRDFDDKISTKKEYKTEKLRIEKLMDKAISKFKSGGEV